ncbi:hypothetical protein C8F01DRAFT_1161449 [Mycena amicta]|nr:hypothetical protein C8F01DRAFT_1161449 [Mycena amicta]
MEDLMRYEFAVGSILDLKLCDRFKSLLNCRKGEARARARLENRQDTMDEKQLQWLAELLDSPNARVREGTCHALAQMRSHWFKLSISVSKITGRLIALLNSDTSPMVRARVFVTLTGISGRTRTRESPNRDCALEILSLFARVMEDKVKMREDQGEPS